MEFGKFVPEMARPSNNPWLKECLPGVMPGRALASNTFDAIGAEALLRGQYDDEADDSGDVDPTNDLHADARAMRLNSLDAPSSATSAED